MAVSPQQRLALLRILEQDSTFQRLCVILERTRSVGMKLREASPDTVMIAVELGSIERTLTVLERDIAKGVDEYMTRKYQEYNAPDAVFARREAKRQRERKKALAGAVWPRPWGARARP